MAAINAAREFCAGKGYSIGSLCGHDPVALILGKDILVAKWKNMTGREKAYVDGLITSPDFREGPVTVKIIRG
jgi:hypothetical protein